MDRTLIIDILDDFAFGSFDIEQTADRITEFYKQTQALQLQQGGVSKSCPCCDGTVYCEGEHYDDLQACLTCGGSGHVC